MDKPEHFDQEYFEDGVIGVMSLLRGILTLPACAELFKTAGDEKFTKAFIQVTSPDRPDNPRRGSELWDHLKATFPRLDEEQKPNSIDVGQIGKAIAGELVAMVLGRR